MSHIGVDGFPRQKEEDEKISKDVAALFGGECWQRGSSLSAVSHT